MAEDIFRAWHVADLVGTFDFALEADNFKHTDFHNLRIRENQGTVYRYGTSGGRAQPPLLGYVFSRSVEQLLDNYLE